MFFIFLDQVKSVIWTSPSIPASSSTKAPKLVTLTTVPWTSASTGYFKEIFDQGSSDNCLTDNLTDFLTLSFSITFACNLSPIL